jgi:Tripartite tricarboxylate transporter TctB family
MQLSGRLSFTLLMLAIFVIMVTIAWGYPPDARFAPFVIGIPGILITLGQLIIDARDLRRSTSARRAGVGSKAAAQTVPAGQEPSVIKRELTIFAYFFGLVAGVVLFGFWIAIPAFIMLFLRFHEREKWLFTISLTACSSIVLYLLFDRVLSIALHEGFVTSAVLDWFAQ